MNELEPPPPSHCIRTGGMQLHNGWEMDTVREAWGGTYSHPLTASDMDTATVMWPCPGWVRAHTLPWLCCLNGGGGGAPLLVACTPPQILFRVD